MELTLICPAKVNLALSVGALDPVSRMHPIASLMVATTYGDLLHLCQLDEGPGRFDIAFLPWRKGEAPAAAVDWPLEKDLMFRAHALLEQWSGRSLPMEAVLRKRIPAGAGLGGGSSDAAAMLVGLNQLFELGASVQDLAGLARQLGSDVVFLVHALTGSPAALVTGLGERIAPVELRQQSLHLVLIFPPFGCPTGPVYRAFDELAAALPTPPRVDEDRVAAIVRQAVIGPSDPFNDLAAPACRVQPELTTWQARLTRDLGAPVHITGSGAAMFVIADGAPAAAALVERIERDTPLHAAAAEMKTGRDWRRGRASG